jgi:hypothetical protein
VKKQTSVRFNRTTGIKVSPSFPNEAKKTETPQKKRAKGSKTAAVMVLVILKK